MTLFDSICCSKHFLRTAVVWDDAKTGSPCFYTYSDICTTASNLANGLDEMVSSDSPIAIYGETCPAVLAAILAVMSLPMHHRRPPGGVVRGVAFLPVRPRGEVLMEEERLLCRCGVEIVLIEISALEVYISKSEATSI